MFGLLLGVVVVGGIVKVSVVIFGVVGGGLGGFVLGGVSVVGGSVGEIVMLVFVSVGKGVKIYVGVGWSCLVIGFV